jgi:hypothetical protein
MRTVDISAGGLMVDRQGMSGAVRVALDLPGGHGRVEAGSSIVRNEPAGSVVRLEDLDAGTQQRLDGFVLGVRHQLARRFARAGD